MEIVTLLLVMSALVNTLFGLVLLLSKDKHTSRKIYAINLVFILIWIGSMIFYRVVDANVLLVYTKFLYISASFIASSFIYFTYSFPTSESLKPSKKLLIILPNLLLILLIICSSSVISNVEPGKFGSRENSIRFGEYFILYVSYILTYFLFGFYRLYRKIVTSTDTSEKYQALYLLIGYILAACVSFTTNLILPWLGYFNFNWLGQISTVFIVIFASYAIFKHHLFNIKFVITEILVGVLWTYALVRFLLERGGQTMIINGGSLVIIVFIGVLLIKSMSKELKASEDLRLLAEDLKKLNASLRKLNEQKTESLSIASHQLRNPLTSLQGFSSLLLKGHFGKVPVKISSTIERMNKSVNSMTTLVNQYLSNQKIENDKTDCFLKKCDLKLLVSMLVDEKNETRSSGCLEISLQINPENSYLVEADSERLSEVILNLLDNATKYTQTGSINVSLTKSLDADQVILSITDTGIGINSNDLPNLFNKNYRASNARSVYKHGSGLGLYVAKKIIEQHKGMIWAESDYNGMSSVFYIKLPSL